MAAADTDVRLSWDLYLTVVRSEVDRLIEIADDLDAPVPSCPGWTVRDLVVHVAGVLRHKVEAMRTATEPPWPLDGLDDPDVRRMLDEQAATLIAELRQRGPREVRHTWYAEDRSNGFWFRRMAHEVTVHRVDAEQAAALEPSPVDEDVAVDGIDEFVRIVLGGPWWDDDADRTAYPVDATVVLEAGGRAWTLELSEDAVDVTGGAAPADVTISGSANDLYLWLWGRVPSHRLETAGRAELVGQIEGRLAEAGD